MTDQDVSSYLLEDKYVETHQSLLQDCHVELYSDEQRKSYSYEQLLSRTKLQSYQVKLIIFCGLAWLLDGVELVAEGFLYPRIEKAWALSKFQLGLLSSLKNLSAALGAITFGVFAELCGTRRMFQTSFIVAASFGGASAFANSFPVLLALRSATGFGLGGNLILAITYLREFLPKAYQARIVVLMHIWIGTGMFLVNLFDWYFGDNWQGFLLAAISPAMFAFLFFGFGIEKPQYLMRHGKMNTVRHLLEELGIDPSKTAKLVYREPEDHSSDQVSSLFTIHSCTLFFHSCMWFGISFGTMAMVWIPDIYVDIFHLHSDVFHALMFVILGFSIFSVLFCAFVIDTFIKPENFLFYALSVVTFVFMFMVVTLYTHQTVERFIVVHFLLALPMGTMFSVVYAVTPRCFPENLRSASLGICGFWKYMGCILAPLIGGWIMNEENIETGYMVYVLGFLVALFGSANIFTPELHKMASVDVGVYKIFDKTEPIL